MKRALTEQEFGRIGVDVGSVPLDVVLLVSGAFDYDSLLDRDVQTEINLSHSISPNLVDKSKICEPACNLNETVIVHNEETDEDEEKHPCTGSKWTNLVYIKGINIRLGQYLSEGIRDLRQTLINCNKVVLRLPRTSVPFTCSSCEDDFTCEGSSEGIFSDKGISLDVLDRKFYDGYANFRVEGSMSAALLPDVEVTFTVSESSGGNAIYTYDCSAATTGSRALDYREIYAKNSLRDVPATDPLTSYTESWAGFDIDFYPNSKENHFTSNWNPVQNNAMQGVKSVSTQVLDLNKLNGVPYGTTWDENGSASIAYGGKSRTSSRYDLYLESLIDGNLPLAEIPESFYYQRANVSGRFEGSKRGFTDTTYIGHKETYTSASLCFASGTLKTEGNQVRRGLEPPLYSARYFTGSVFPLDTIGDDTFKAVVRSGSIQNNEVVIKTISSSVSTGSAAEPEVLYYYAAPSVSSLDRRLKVLKTSEITFETSSGGKLDFKRSTLNLKAVFSDYPTDTFVCVDSSYYYSGSVPEKKQELHESLLEQLYVGFWSGSGRGTYRFGEKLQTLKDFSTLETILTDYDCLFITSSGEDKSFRLNYNQVVYPKNKTVPDRNDIIYRYLSGSFHRVPDSIIYLPDTDRILVADIFGKVVDVIVNPSGSTMTTSSVITG